MSLWGNFSKRGLACVVIFARTHNFIGPNKRPSSPIQAHFEIQRRADSVSSCPFRFRRMLLPSDQLNCRSLKYSFLGDDINNAKFFYFVMSAYECEGGSQAGVAGRAEFNPFDHSLTAIAGILGVRRC